MPSERRREQNRIAQQRWRERKRQHRTGSSTPASLAATIAEEDSGSQDVTESTTTAAVDFYARLAQSFSLAPLCQLYDVRRQVVLQPRWDLIRVLAEAATRLGASRQYFDGMCERLLKESGMQLLRPCPLGPSCWSCRSIFTKSQEQFDWEKLPSNLQPTQLATRIDHHPCIDLAFPWPTVRERIFAHFACGRLNREAFCRNNRPGNHAEDAPYLVYGDDPFDPEAYEVNEDFVAKFPFLFDGDVLKRTNWWRRQRGASPIMVVSP